MAGRRPYQALEHPDFRRLWISQIVSITGSQMQSAAIHWHVYVLTRSPLALGAVGLTRVLPIVLFSLGGGVVADRMDRRRVMFVAQSLMAVFSAGLAVFTFRGGESVAAVFAANALVAAASAFDNPARQALVPRLVPREDLPGALSLNLAAFQAALIGGPALAGLLIAGAAGVGPPGTAVAQAAGSTRMLAWIYVVNAVSFLAVLAALALMRTPGDPERSEGPPESALQSLKAGLRFVFTTPIMVWTTALDFVATFFSGANSLLPIFADQVLRVGPAGYGWLVAAAAVGALVGSLYTSLVPLPPRHGRLLLGAVAAYGAATVVYGLSRSFPLTLLALAGTGLADLVSTVIRQTLRQLVTPDGLRGRMTAVNMIFFMGGPQLGEMEAGLVASLFASTAVGVTVSVVSGGLATMLFAAVIALAVPILRGYRAPVGS
jgi:MFS family permease